MSQPVNSVKTGITGATGLNFQTNIFYARNYLSWQQVTNNNNASVQRLDYMGSVMNITSNNILRAITTYIPLTITTEYSQSPELIAYDYYGSVNLYWIITRYNGIYNVLDENVGLNPGDQIKVPDPNQVKQWLQSMATAVAQQANASTGGFVTV